MDFLQLLQHRGHDVVIESYGDAMQVAVVCQTCDVCLESVERPDNVTVLEVERAVLSAEIHSPTY